MKINQSIKGLDFDPDWSILDIDSRISKVSFWYWVITWFPGCEMWPKSACDFLTPLLLSRNRRFAECILIPRKPNPCSIEFGLGSSNENKQLGKHSPVFSVIDTLLHWARPHSYRIMQSMSYNNQMELWWTFAYRRRDSDITDYWLTVSMCVGV